MGKPGVAEGGRGTRGTWVCGGVNLIVYREEWGSFEAARDDKRLHAQGRRIEIGLFWGSFLFSVKLIEWFCFSFFVLLLLLLCSRLGNRKGGIGGRVGAPGDGDESWTENTRGGPDEGRL